MPITMATITNCVEQRQGLKHLAARDFCALECLANEPLFAKTDIQKAFLLWEVVKTEADGIEITASPDSWEKHRWVFSLFLGWTASQAGVQGTIRFPFNTWDADPAHSLSWRTIEEGLKKSVLKKGYLLPRWSTASRSCLVMVPETVAQLRQVRIPAEGTWDAVWDTLKPNRDSRDRESDQINQSEWEPFMALLDEASAGRAPAEELGRFYTLNMAPGAAAKKKGVELKIPPGKRSGQYRLYSVKTGVDYVGSKFEGPHKGAKNLLERNCVLAMARSDVIANMANSDGTFGVQTEVLTVTAPTTMRDEDNQIIRDGFQVRDLSCMRSDLTYIPGQAIPYARASFDHMAGTDDQCEFWRKNFAVPLGRAKARLFLNYGLIHTSANAQNFLLGFTGPVLQQFVARDIGDTSWHDDYIEQYFSVGSGVRDAYYRESENSKKIGERVAYHLLRTSHSTEYPAPRMIRLAAYSLLTHRFADKLQAHHWTPKHVYSFATGILDGFHDFMKEALELDALPDPGKAEHPQISKFADITEEYSAPIQEVGKEGGYPPAFGRGPRAAQDGQPADAEGIYGRCVNRILSKEAEELFSWADTTRTCGEIAAAGDKIDARFKKPPDPGMSILINAEEIFRCAGFEKLLVTAEGAEKDRIHKLLNSRFLSGKWPPTVK